MWLLLALAACPSPRDTDDGEAETDTNAVGDTDTDAPVEPEDVDQDGSFTPDDCDDFDPAVHPGASEVWNGQDDDCDGRSDADGAYAGTHRVVATAVYEGDSYRFELDCPTVLNRNGRAFSFTVTCSPDPGDPEAQLLLGSKLTITEKENVININSWDGAVLISSSSGWDSEGQGALRWSTYTAVELATSMNSFSLDLAGSGPLTSP